VNDVVSKPHVQDTMQSVSDKFEIYGRFY